MDAKLTMSYHCITEPAIPFETNHQLITMSNLPATRIDGYMDAELIAPQLKRVSEYGGKTRHQIASKVIRQDSGVEMMVPCSGIYELLKSKRCKVSSLSQVFGKNKHSRKF